MQIQHNFTLETWQSCLKQLSFGKRLPDAVYWHICGLADVPRPLAELIQQINEMEFTVVKCLNSELSLSLLNYPDFFNNPFPILTKSYRIDLVTRKIQARNYNTNNPPILHRKELLLPNNHFLIPQWQAITNYLEKEGLFKEPKKIGFKKYWDSLLLDKKIDLSSF